MASQLQGKMREMASPGVIDGYMRTHSVRKLQLGAGTTNMPDWLNSDIEPTAGQAYIDCSKRLPCLTVPSNTFTANR
jgi:hypothetical protein